MLLVLLLIFPTLDSHSNSFVYAAWGQAVDTNELEWESRVGRINSKTSKIIRSGFIYKWVKVRVKSGED
jgi:hypothetical protein